MVQSYWSLALSVYVVFGVVENSCVLPSIPLRFGACRVGNRVGTAHIPIPLKWRHTVLPPLRFRYSFSAVAFAYYFSMFKSTSVETRIFARCSRSVSADFPAFWAQKKRATLHTNPSHRCLYGFYIETKCDGFALLLLESPSAPFADRCLETVWKGA